MTSSVGGGGRGRRAVWLGGIAVLTVALVGVLGRGDGGLCRAGVDPRPKGAPPAPTGATAAAGVWLANVGGGEPRRVVAAPGSTGGEMPVLQWLGDGRLVRSASTSAAVGYPIFVTLDGGLSPVTDLPPGRDQDWSRDGKRVAFVDQTGLVTVAADGSDRRLLVPHDSHESELVRQPEWSPDGTQLVFTADSMPRSAVERLEIIQADGTGHRVLIEKDGPGFLEGAWSPDGREIAFVGGGGAYGSWIGVVRPDGSGYRRIARHCSGRDPHWSPDGRQIVFNDFHSLVVMNADGSGMQRLPDTWDGYSAAWSDHGIAFLRF